MKIAIVNLGQIVSGDWRDPFVAGDTILTDDGRIARAGTASAEEVETADVVIDAGGMTAIPGLINSHVHVTFGDYTPRQRTVGFLESYLHGGVTTSISASEVHVPGRPSDPEGVKALALAAQRCFRELSPRRNAGHRRLGDPRAGPDRRRFQGACRRRRDLGQSRLRRGQDRIRLHTARRRRQGRGPDHHLSYRRLVDPRLGRHHRRSSARHASACVVPHQWRSDCHAGCGFRAGDQGKRDGAAGLHRRQSADGCCCARGSPTSSAPSIGSSWEPTRRPAPASCRSDCFIRSPTAPA